jgi:site-specific DNA recombinase
MSELAITSLTRCAIYTRKSTDHLLDRDVNSLATQREICSAYVKSQQYKGWTELPQHYDDGGQPGTNIDRPALSALMRDIENGLVDTVVVYKIDRLSRSLMDFVRIIEIFDGHGISLVSVSQAFDTSDSMGRMILNVLLTFSQFEHELIAERIRDGMRMRKRHGMWHGGLPPFGYVATKEGLKIVEEEAEIVRFLFDEFLKTGTYTAVSIAVHAAELRHAVKTTKHGKKRGGNVLGAGTIYNILRSPVYVGEIAGHDGTYQGQHEPIISRETWEAAKALCASRAKPLPHTKQTNHFLAGLLWDDYGRHMLLSVDWWKDRQYYYYNSSNAFWAQRERRKAYRTNADRLDQLIMACVTEFLCDRRLLRAALKTLGVHGGELDKLGSKGPVAAEHLTNTPPEALSDLFSAIVESIELGQEHVTITFRSIELRRFLQWKGVTRFRGRPSDWACSEAKYHHEVAVRAISDARTPVLNVKPRDPQASCVPDAKLVSLLQSARGALRLVEDNRERSVRDLAAELRCRPGHFSRLVRLNYLSPDIVTAILDGTQPPALTRDVLFKADLPLDWSVQRKLFGFPAPERKLDRTLLFGRPRVKVAREESLA